MTITEDTRLEVQQDTQFVLDIPEFGKDRQYNISLLFEKPGVEAEIIGTYRLTDNQVLNLATSVVHKVPQTRCFTYIKGVLEENTSSDYIGKIIIEKPAQQTSSYLEDNVIMVGESARNNSQPILEIEADDVKASHGATTGQIDDEQIYYLRTRGMTEAEAKNVIIKGFFNSLLNRIKDEKIRDAVSKKLYA